MKVQLLDVRKDALVEAKLIRAGLVDMKGHIHDGWQFDWKKHFGLVHSQAFKIVTMANPNKVQGLMIFQMLQKTIPYMAYLESAPHNKGSKKELDFVAGCLIAKACQLSFTEGKDDHKGYLSFRCMDEIVIANYGKYGAVRIGNTHSLLIEPAVGSKLIEEYLF